MDTLTLSQADTRRLEKIAQIAGRTPRTVLKYVLRDGFDATEQAAQTTVARMQSGKRISHQQAMQQLDHMIEQHGRSKKKAA
jgi:predicted transcriptional regulator